MDTEGVWISFDATFKQWIKEAVLVHLGTVETPIVRKAIAVAVSNIGLIEIPRDEFAEPLFTFICNLSGDDINNRMTSTSVLNLIFDDLDPQYISEDNKLLVVSGYVNNIFMTQAHNELTELSLKALFSNLNLSGGCFANPTSRQIIMQKVLMACEHPDDNIKVLAFSLLVEIGINYYDYIEEYYLDLCRITGNGAMNEDYKVGAQAIEFWTALGEEEFDKAQKKKPIKNYIARSMPELTYMLLKHITRFDGEEDEDEVDQWSISVSVINCLVVVAKNVRDPIMDPVLAFSQQFLESPNFKERYAALIVIGTVTEGPNK